MSKILNKREFLKRPYFKILFYIIILVIGIFAFIESVYAYVNVKGYYKKDGTYVRPHVRSNPNGLKYDNYSYRYGDGLYNKTYGTRGSNWDTPTYITDPDYYTGKSLYESGSSGSNSYDSYSPVYTYTKPTCPSHSYYDSLNKTCKCNQGYIVDDNKCVYANYYCENNHGYGSKYSYSKKNVFVEQAINGMTQQLSV